MLREKGMMLNELMQLDFRLKDLQLFLDTHPNEQRAVEEYNMAANKANLMRRNYETLYGNLTIEDKDNNTVPWSWIGGPWPWEYNGGDC